MGADFSRVRFNPLLDYAGVELEQGRVLLDADVNELMAIADRGSRARTSDTLGRATVSSTTRDAFKITVAAGTLQIGKGRLYVDGLLAENHGAASTDPTKRVFDDLLGETSFADPVRYDAQPYLPNAPALPAVGRHLVYLDVWDREVTYLEQPGLIESAVGVDTSSRLQTVWQVRVLAKDAGPGTTCGSPDADVPGWSTIIAPSTGVLSTGTFDVAPVDDPCELPPTGGFRGLENQLYRVEIHDAGQLGAGATFKWSRMDASVGSRVASVISDSELELETLGRDDVLRFNTGDWVEIIDDVREFSQAPGEMRRITVVEATRRIQFTPALPAAMLPGSFPDSVFPGNHNWRVRLWDQKGRIFRTDAGGTPVQVQDLDAAGSTGVIAIPTAGTTLLLENGVTVSFASTGAKGFRAGDYWVFAARTADASVEILDRAPPRGIHHHYARLGLWDVPAGAVTDCRNHWPPRGDGGGCCISVRPGESIQAAIDDLPPVGGCVCLKSGLHEIAAPLVIARENISLHGENLGAIVQSQAGGALLSIGDLGGRGIRVSSITFVQGETQAATTAMISVVGTDGLVVHDCRLQSLAGNATGIGLFIAAAENATVEGCSLEGCGVGIRLAGRCENVLIADSDIEIVAPARDTPVTVGVLASGPTGPIAVERNRIAGAVSGVVINDTPDEQPGSLAAGSRVVNNRIDLVASAATGEFAFVFGIDVAAARGIVSGNHVTDGSNGGHVGIRVAGDASIVHGNIVSTAAVEGPNLGIVVGFGEDDDFLPLERVIVTGNQLQGRQHGIFVLGAVRCVVSDNELGGGGIFLTNADDCHIKGNLLAGPFVAIQSHGGARNHILGNTIDRGAAGVLLSSETGPMISGNRVTGASFGGIIVQDILEHCYIVENRLTNCGHGTDTARGIDALNVDGELHIEANEVMNTGVPLDLQQPAAATAWGINAQNVLEARVESNIVSYPVQSPRPLAAEDRALRMLGPEKNIFSPVLLKGSPVQIAGNKFIGTGATALVELREERPSPSSVRRFENVLFSGNYCMHFTGPVTGQAATVSLVGSRCTVSGNIVEAFTPRFPSYHFHGIPGPFIGNVSHAANLGRTQLQEFPAPEGNFNQIPLT
jgi:nitrous oxidase accessory protein NosD